MNSVAVTPEIEAVFRTRFMPPSPFVAVMPAQVGPWHAQIPMDGTIQVIAVLVRRPDSVRPVPFHITNTAGQAGLTIDEPLLAGDVVEFHYSASQT